MDYYALQLYICDDQTSYATHTCFDGLVSRLMSTNIDCWCLKFSVLVRVLVIVRLIHCQIVQLQRLSGIIELELYL